MASTRNRDTGWPGRRANQGEMEGGEKCFADRGYGLFFCEKVHVDSVEVTTVTA
jgi:hypothetical protein